MADPVAARPHPSWPTGTWGNVHTIAETGDMLGMEARFFVLNGRRMVEFVWCEGWCNRVFVRPVSRGNAGFMFHYSEAMEGGGVAEMHFVAWPAGSRLNVSAWQGREKLDGESGPQRLRRLPKPFAIPFAKANGAR